MAGVSSPHGLTAELSRRKPLRSGALDPYTRQMLLIFGTTLRNKVLVVVNFICQFCGTQANQDVIESATKVSVFFIPLFTIGRRYFVTCTNCGGTTPLTKQQATHGIEWAARNRQVS
jgi:hypothetical protein